MIIYPDRELRLKKEERHHFQIFAVIMLDFIWRKRNDIIHNHSSLSIEEASFQIKGTYEDYKDAWKKKVDQQSKEENWHPPPLNYQSYSFDAAVQDQFSVVSAIKRNHSGDILGILTENVQTTIPLIAEAKAALLAANMASNQGLAIIEGDSQSIISSIESPDISTFWNISTIIKDIQHLSNLYQNWKFAKIHRSQNRCAHSVVQWAATNLVFGSIPIDNIPTWFLYIDSGKNPPQTL
ncbi:hypothetical protein F2P56_008898 [Juglans regia]|uniref:RNase H type-1 domain-containing protein n=1 Tax=Juglans regia TaxID=51240 RepID=A0A834D1H7_JUGRE|nr:hypothetical protein F2P56_008898 [Juglans regia]